jgi:hypothetical protein
MGGGAWPFVVGVLIRLVDFDNGRYVVRMFFKVVSTERKLLRPISQEVGSNAITGP